MTQQHNTTDSDANILNEEIDQPLDLSTDHQDGVKVQVEKIAKRQRQITAQVEIPHPSELIWRVLTDYEALAEFIPNLAKSRLLEHPSGGIRLEQVGSQRLLNFKFCARVVLDLEEYFPTKINFQMVEGDFKGFSGSWLLEPSSLDTVLGTNLSYTIQVWPKLTMPVALIEHRISADLRLNLLAIRDRVQSLAS